MSGPAPLRQRATAAFGVAVLVLAMLAAQVLARLDRVHVHVRCEEHGDLKHAEPRGVAQAEPTPRPSTMRSHTPATPAEHHGHCLVGDVAAPLAAAAAAWLTPAPAACTPARSLLTPAPHLRPRLLRFAPKTSPPHLA